MKVIASTCLCNTASLNIYQIEHHEDKVLAGLNDDTPKWYKLYYTRQQGYAYFNWGGHRRRIAEFIVV